MEVALIEDHESSLAASRALTCAAVFRNDEDVADFETKKRLRHDWRVVLEPRAPKTRLAVKHRRLVAELTQQIDHQIDLSRTAAGPLFVGSEEVNHGRVSRDGFDISMLARLNPKLVPNAEAPLIDVYVIHWHAPEWCVDATASMLRSENVKVRCHVIDNGSTGGSELAAMLDTRVELISLSENLGYSGAANEGFVRALADTERSDLIAIAAHDARVEPDTFALLSAATRADPAIGVVGPVLSAPALEAGGEWRGWRARAIKTWNADTPFEDRDWVSGTLLAVRPSCIEQIGGFDERLGSYVEDVDLCLRAHDRGWRVGVATQARAAGIGSASSNVTFMVDVNSAMVAVKHRGLKGSFGILLRYAYWILRGAVASLDFRRDAARRRASLEHSRDHARALGHLLRHWSRVRDFAHHPDRGVRRFG
jgi:GT2 family glycosyltransferase